MSYCCNCAKVGVPVVPSNRSTALMPGSARRLFLSVFGGELLSANTISTRKSPPHATGQPESVSAVATVVDPLYPPVASSLLPRLVPDTNDRAILSDGPLVQTS